MEADFTLRLGDTATPITATLTDEDGVPVNIQGATVKFRMWPEAGGTIKVNANATNAQVGDGSDGTRGHVSYQWQTTDTDTAGDYLAEWQVTFANTRVQTFPNEGALHIVITQGYSAAASTYYLTLDELKDTLELQNDDSKDDELLQAIAAASRAIDKRTERVFYAHTGAATARTYTALDSSLVLTDPFYELSGVTVGGTALVQDTDFYVEPSEGPPWDALRALSWYCFGTYRRWVTVTAKWGYAAVPDEIKVATKILATRYFRRPREAAFGVAGMGLDSAVYVSRWDPEVDAILASYRRLVAA